MDKAEMFPVMNADPKFRGAKDYVPMEWVLRHHSQCLINHGQTPQRLKERGGLSHKELYAVIMDKRFRDVSETDAECQKLIKSMIDTYVEFNSESFTQYFSKLNDIAQNPTHENFVAIQKLRSDILNDYTLGTLSEFEKHTLYDASLIIMGKIRKRLQSDTKRSDTNGPEKNQDGTD